MFPSQPCQHTLDNVLVVNLVLTLTVITFRLVSVNLQHYQRTNGSCRSSVCCFVRTGNQHGDIEIKDYVILPRGEDNSLPPRTLMMDVTMTHDHYGRGRTTQCTNRSLTLSHTQSVLHWSPSASDSLTVL